MKSPGEMTIGELAAYICSQLKTNGISTTLTGGGCVSIYTSGEYVSYDLDFVENISAGRRKLKRALKEIGFIEINRHFSHPETKFFLEFPSGPLAVGNEPPKAVVQLRFDTGILNILSATDCIKDRLAAYFHWDDQQCLKQAIQVARQNKIDLKEITRWATKEGYEEKVQTFKQRLK